PIALLKLAQRGHRIGKGPPRTNRLMQGSELAGSGDEMEAIGERPDHRFQHRTVALVRTAFRLRLKFPIKFQEVSIHQTMVYTVLLKDCPQRRQNPRLPVNQSAVTVKADGRELFKVHR